MNKNFYYVNDVRRIYREKLFFANIVVGGLLYSVSIGALCSKNPGLIALLSLPLILSAIIPMRGYYVQILDELIAKHPENKSNTINFIKSEIGFINFTIQFMGLLCGILIYTGLLGSFFINDLGYMPELIGKFK